MLGLFFSIFVGLRILKFTIFRGFGKRDDFDFDKVNFPFLDGDIPRRNHMGYTYGDAYLNLLDSPTY